VFEKLILKRILATEKKTTVLSLEQTYTGSKGMEVPAAN
jgi:hypothetical protein